ncbi:MAG: alanine racemase [bacterium]
MSKAWRTRALIDLSALRHNVTVVSDLVGDARIFAVVKADAYGHGISNVVPAISDLVDGFAVATLEEGIRCREYAADNPIMVLSEFSGPDQLDLFRNYRLQPVVHREQQAQWISQADGLPQGAWLKIDSGMNRLGIAPEKAAALITQLGKSIDTQRLGLMSHLASADDVQCDQTKRQVERFLRCAVNHPGEISIANSAGVVNWPMIKQNTVRPGLMLYGISPTEERSSSTLGLRPVMQLETRLIAVKQISQGDAVGYGGTWIAARPTKIGVAGFGYADGYPRSISNRGVVIIGDRQAPVIGKVSMDMMTLDVSECTDAKEGDIVQLWGPQLGVDRVAQWADTIAYELLCGVSPRVPRVTLD